MADVVSFLLLMGYAAAYSVAGIAWIFAVGNLFRVVAFRQTDTLRPQSFLDENGKVARRSAAASGVPIEERHNLGGVTPDHPQLI